MANILATIYDRLDKIVRDRNNQMTMGQFASALGSGKNFAQASGDAAYSNARRVGVQEAGSKASQQNGQSEEELLEQIKALIDDKSSQGQISDNYPTMHQELPDLEALPGAVSNNMMSQETDPVLQSLLGGNFFTPKEEPGFTSANVDGDGVTLKYTRKKQDQKNRSFTDPPLEAYGGTDLRDFYLAS